MLVSGRIRVRKVQQLTYLVGIKCRIVQPVRPVDDIRTLRSALDYILVGSLVDGLDFVTAEDDGFDRPVWCHDVIHLGRNGCDDTEVVACTLHSPPQVGTRVNCLQLATCKNDVHGGELIRDKAIVTLEPAVASSKSRAQEADTLTGPSNCSVLSKLL